MRVQADGYNHFQCDEFPAHALCTWTILDYLGLSWTILDYLGLLAFFIQFCNTPIANAMDAVRLAQSSAVSLGTIF